MTPECEFQPFRDFLQGFGHLKFQLNCGMKDFVPRSGNFRHQRSQEGKKICEQKRVVSIVPEV